MSEVLERREWDPRAPSDEAVGRLQTLIAFQHDLSTTATDLAALLTIATRCAQTLTGARGVLVEISEQDSLVCRGAVGSVAGQLGVRARANGRLSGLSFLSGRVLTCDDAAIDARLDESARHRPEQRSLLAVPLVSARAPLGVLTVVAPFEHAFGEEHVQPLRLLAAIVAAKLEAMRDLQHHEILANEHAMTLAALRETESRFRHTFDHAGVGMALIATDNRWLKVNAALCRLVGYSAADLLAHGSPSITHPDDLARVEAFTQGILTGDASSGELEKRYLHRNGTIVWALLTISVVKDATGQALYLIAQIQDITARKQSEEALQRLATRDYLTGLYNRRELVRLLEEETLRARRHQRPLSLIMVDVDSFKNVNDSFGHQAGDRALQHVAAMLSDGVRSFDRVARYGGEEFAVLLPETGSADAFAVAERIRTRIAAQTLSIAEDSRTTSEIPITISAGVATMPVCAGGGNEMGPAQLIKEADLCLYAAKRAGRNRCLASSGTAEGGPSDATSNADLPAYDP